MTMRKLMKRSTVVRRLVDYAVKNLQLDVDIVSEHGWVGYAQMDNSSLTEEYNTSIGYDEGEPIKMVVNDIEDMSELGPDDVYTMKPMIGEDGRTFPAGTKCTIMDEGAMDEVGDPIVVQVDDCGVEIQCYRDLVIECCEVE